MKRIGIDIDNTIGKYLEVFCDTANRVFGKSISIADMTDMSVHFENLGLLTGEQVKHIKSLDEELLTFKKMNFYPDAVDVLQTLSKEIDVFFISNRDNYDYAEMKSHTAEWLATEGINSYVDIIFTQDKRKISDELELDYFVEDNLSEVQKLIGGVSPIFVLSRPWNSAKEINHASVNYVKDWYEIDETIRRN